MTSTTKIRVVIEYEVVKGTSGSLEKQKVLETAKLLAGDRLTFVTYEIVKGE